MEHSLWLNKVLNVNTVNKIKYFNDFFYKSWSVNPCKVLLWLITTVTFIVKLCHFSLNPILFLSYKCSHRKTGTTDDTGLRTWFSKCGSYGSIIVCNVHAIVSKYSFYYQSSVFTEITLSAVFWLIHIQFYIAKSFPISF